LILISLHFYLGFTYLSYTKNNYKYVALLLGYWDVMITNFYVISCFVHFLGSFANAFVWDTYGEIPTLGFFLVNQTFLIIMVMISPIWNEIFIFTILLLRFNGSLMNMNQQLFFFGIFRKKGIIYSKMN